MPREGYREFRERFLPSDRSRRGQRYKLDVMKSKIGPTLVLAFFLALQAILLLVMAFVPFGFDRPSSWGLDFGHLLMFGGAYTFMLVVGLIVAAIQKNKAELLGQLVGPLLAGVLGLLAQGR